MSMTARQMFEALLTELAKQGAPNMLLSDFNYFMNKAVNQYVNKRYNLYDISQQTTDDLRVLKSTAILDPVPIYTHKVKSILKYGTLDISSYNTGLSNLFGGTYEIFLPSDYLHMLNCMCIYRMDKRHKCWDKGNYVLFPATRLTADTWTNIVNNYYLRPCPERPYYYIHNVNTSESLPYSWNNGSNAGTDYISVSKTLYDDEESTESIENSHPRVIELSFGENEVESSIVERDACVRYGNPSLIRCEIRYGRDNTVFVLEKVFIDYIKAPLTIRLTLELVDLTDDQSLILEFPDYVCQEIIDELVTLVMENNTNLRIQTFNAVTLSIANPAQQLTTQPQQGG